MFSDTLKFLADLKENNNRDWFKANKERYLEEVVRPAQRFIEAFADPLHSVSPFFVADPRPVGGSLFRIYRDTRFSSDKSPYKTHVGIHFRHEDGRDAHCPGFYFHLDEEHCFAGAGMWHPERGALERIRRAIESRPQVWEAMKRSLRPLELGGESLKRPPRGVAKAHPQLEDLKRVDFMTMSEFAPYVPLQAAVDSALQFVRRSTPLIRFLCEATGHEF